MVKFPPKAALLLTPLGLLSAQQPAPAQSAIVSPHQTSAVVPSGCIPASLFFGRESVNIDFKNSEGLMRVTVYTDQPRITIAPADGSGPERTVSKRADLSAIRALAVRAVDLKTPMRRFPGFDGPDESTSARAGERRAVAQTIYNLIGERLVSPEPSRIVWTSVDSSPYSIEVGGSVEKTSYYPAQQPRMSIQITERGTSDCILNFDPPRNPSAPNQIKNEPGTSGLIYGWRSLDSAEIAQALSGLNKFDQRKLSASDTESLRSAKALLTAKLKGPDFEQLVGLRIKAREIKKEIDGLTGAHSEMTPIAFRSANSLRDLFEWKIKPNIDCGSYTTDEKVEASSLIAAMDAMELSQTRKLRGWRPPPRRIDPKIS